MSFKDEMDTNIDNYTEDELLDIVGLDSNATEEDITSRLDKIINKYTLENNKKYANFFTEVNEKLLVDEDNNMDKNTDNTITGQTDTWYQNQYLKSQNQNQNDKITTRHSTTQVFNRGAIPVMKQETLGINNTIPLNIAQDSLNPVLRQIIWRYITIDSKYRPNNIPFTFDPNAPQGRDTNFTFSLSESLRNVLSIQLSSLYIPSSWYTFDNYIGNTCFYIQYLPHNSGDQIPLDTSWNDPDVSCCRICITEGNYSSVETLVEEINFDISYCCNNSYSSSTVNDLSGLRLVVQNDRVSNKQVQFLNLTNFWIKLTFYDPKINIENCCNCRNIKTSCSIYTTYLQNLGYYLGFRILQKDTQSLTTLLPPYESLTPSPTRTNLYTLRSKYFTALEAGNDISLNILGQDIVNTLGQWMDSNALFPATYYENTTAGSNVFGAAPSPVDLIGSEYFLLTLDDYTSNYPNNGLVSIGSLSTKLDVPSYAIRLGQDFSSNICDLSSNKVGSGATQFVPTFPRKLTQAQLYSVNQIINNRHQSSLLQSPDPPDLFANINLAINNGRGISAITYNNTNTVYERKYFGPVTLQRFGIKLLDSKGNLVNLHGQSWSFTLAVQQLYQY